MQWGGTRGGFKKGIACPGLTLRLYTGHVLRMHCRQTTAVVQARDDGGKEAGPWIPCDPFLRKFLFLAAKYVLKMTQDS